MFRKILIANRGEIAVRVAKTARRMGVATVAVYSDADKDAPHVKACDEAVHIGPPAPSESYLRAERIIEAAKRTGAEAIHPGYGFLSENAAFAEALEKAGIIFIGPTAKTIRAMGSKSAAKDLMEEAGVPTTPGYQGEDQSFETFKREAARIGYPVLLKATAGGGGKGMRMVARAEDLEEGVASAAREGKSAFGDPRLLIEKYLPRARHVEVQIFGDGKGEVVHFFERDCSVQRRHQKIIEEAPAPRLPADVRARLLEAGVNAGRAVDYRGAGTVEFLYDGGENVYFMEMNTRLQVEHPVSEAITGVDLVEWQLRVASGEGLPLKQTEIIEHGHAFEARLYAENPDQNFAPSIGDLSTLRLPADLARIDSGVAQGQTITPHYDPMIAKIITHGATREEALARLRTALGQTRVAGLETNARFLAALSADADFAAGDVSTRYIDEHSDALFAKPDLGNRALAAALFWRHSEATKNLSNDPWSALVGFRLNKPAKSVYWIELDGAPAIARLVEKAEGFDVTIEPSATAAIRREGGASGEPFTFSFGAEKIGDDFRITQGGAQFTAAAVRHGEGLRVFIGANAVDIAFPDPLSGALGHHSAEGSLTAPMPGVITLLKAAPGDSVEAGATLLVMEAMKMEHAIKAPHDGVIKSFRFKAGDQVKDGDLLVEFEESA
ncbi:MAG: acetyl/propionyl/methylcrotonyl-CoA carboxylase subunit alpha [Caulobacterales bacterium]|nr:acetyl/propionyl/methylcrotonyl-CoA carboxylase subunit alpha [Caulobacterales bacterium]